MMLGQRATMNNPYENDYYNNDNNNIIPKMTIYLYNPWPFF